MSKLKQSSVKQSLKNEYTRGQLAKKTGCNIETVRYYENKALMPEPKRSENDYRIYKDTDVKRLNFIRRCRELGFTVCEISELLSLVDTHNYSCTDISSITKNHIKQVKSKIADLKNILQSLQDMTKKCDTGDRPDCPIIEALFGES